MPARIFFHSAIVLFVAPAMLWGQAPPTLVDNRSDGEDWRTKGIGSAAATAALNIGTATVSGRGVTSWRAAPGELPRDHGQIGRVYDVRPYTTRVTSTNKPEQGIVDWILRETGTELWFGEPFGILSANRGELYVYHTPQVHEIVMEVLDRFNVSEAESHVFGVRLVTIGSPNWRSRLSSLMRPVGVQTPGIEAWLVSKENSAVISAELKKRSDFRQHNSPNLLIHNGQSQALSRMRPRNYVRSVHSSGNAIGGRELDMAQVEEGYSMEFSPLLSLDGSTIDAVIKCDVKQIEKLVSVHIDAPSSGGEAQKVQIQVPQMANWRIHERFRWPADQVLVISCGVVPTPAPDRGGVLGINNLLGGEQGRADALLFVESKGRASQALVEPKTSDRSAATQYQGRY